MQRLLTLVGLCLAPTLGSRKMMTRMASNDTVVAGGGGTSGDCEALVKILVAVKGSGWKLAAQAACRAQPDLKQLANDGARLGGLLKKAMAPGGTWDLINQIKDGDGSKKNCWRNETLRTTIPFYSSQSCDMKHDGKCYGKCPFGFKPSTLIGKFKPVCSSVCAATDFPVACGFGCSANRFQCVVSILKQVASVVNGVNQVASYVGANSRVISVVNAVTSFSEFMFRVVPKIIDAVKKGMNIMKAEESAAMTVLLLFQFLVTEVPKLGFSVHMLGKSFENIGSTFSDLVKKQIASKSIKPQTLITAIVHHAGDVWEGLDAMLKMTEAFALNKCAVASPDVAFTVDEIGMEDFEGPYIQNGIKNGRPAYRQQMDLGKRVEYHKGEGWVMCKKGMLRDQVLYTSSEDSYDYPTEGWSVFKNNGEAPAPEVVEVRERMEDPSA